MVNLAQMRISIPNFLISIKSLQRDVDIALQLTFLIFPILSLFLPQLRDVYNFLVSVFRKKKKNIKLILIIMDIYSNWSRNNYFNIVVCSVVEQVILMRETKKDVKLRAFKVHVQSHHSATISSSVDSR